MRKLARLGLFAALPALLLHAPEAEACGGTFCDTGPQSMPVDQTGENILFVIDQDRVEAHIQIQYDPETEAANFAWVIPVQVLPDFSVGSEELFVRMLAATVPTYGYSTQIESCPDPGGDGDPTGGDGDPGGTGDPGDGDGDPDPMVVFQDIVGAYEIAVLDGGTVQSVMTWLADNGYQQDAAAEPVLGEYLDAGFLFVALKLKNNAEVSEIHPIVLSYDGNEPCVPLKLTRIAAADDMDVRVFFLAEDRAVPTNYKHVLVNPVKIDWMNFGQNYKEVVSLAVDAFESEGRAFVTEYAGTSAVVDANALVDPNWNSAPFAAMQNNPEDVGAELEAQGLMGCMDIGGGVIECDIHPMVEGLLAQYLPVPAMVDPGNFYSCMLCYAGLIDQNVWDAALFAQGLDERLIAPALHAQELIESWPYLSRMYTTISPNEMTIDPIFHTNPDLQDVPNIRQGNRLLLCNGGGVFTLPDGREIYMTNPNLWPLVFPGEMPYVEDIEQAAMAGPNQAINDQTQAINDLIALWNMQHGWPPGGDGDGDGDGDATGDGDPSGTGSDMGEGTGGSMIDGEGAACACTTDSRDDHEGGVAGGLALLTLFGLGRRRSRRRARAAS